MTDDQQTIGSEEENEENEANKAKAQPSGPAGDNPATAGTGETKVVSQTPENAKHRLDPSAPGSTGTTPGSNVK